MSSRIQAWVVAGLLGSGLMAGCTAKTSESPADRAAVLELAGKVEADVRRIEGRTLQLAAATAQTYVEADRLLAGVDTNKYKFTPEGCYYKAVDDGGPALWVSGVVPVDDKVQRIAWFTEGIDAELMTIVREMPEVAQDYYNDKHSLNRIYPPFDVLSQYEPKMDIPSFNFYYLADAQHNPDRKAVWVDEPYVDPAGRGWMVSCIGPVYEGEELVGVVGLDVTVAEIVENYLQPASRAWALVDRNGTIVAATEAAIELFDMPPLTDHRYVNTVKSDRYRSEDYNLLQSPNADVRRLAEEVMKNGATGTLLKHAKGRSWIVATPIKALGWTALLADDRPR